ncbi:PP2C family protein-serine/threonine phosphatase [Streptomyces sp. NPDC021020]|uniref:PP2C family protein-serine/threonine phosphatase n=1 Tax=Streptomyces sp. NPDC021020 TaxID=3365109 RepID=UPI003787AAF5
METAPGLPESTPPGLAPALQDGLVSWSCDLSLLHELTERLARTALLDDALREVALAGCALVGARRGLATLAPADDLGPDTTVGHGLGHCDLGALETVGFGAVPTGADEAAHPDLRQGPGARERHHEVAAQLGLAAAYGLALAVDRPAARPEGDTVPSPDSAASSANGAAYSAADREPAGPATFPGDGAAEDFRDFSTTGPAASATAAAPSAGAPALRAAGPARRRLGAVVWFYDEPAEPTPRQRRLAGMYVRYAAEHLARGLDLARARRDAAALSAEMLPARLPRVPGVRMAVRHQSGPRGGGDWYDALPLPEGALGLAVGGVTGAGPGAVAARDRLRASLRAYAVMEGEDPVAVLSDLELLLRLTEPARSATALFGHVSAPQSAGSRRVTLAGAGHCPPLLVGDHRCEFVETSLSAPLNMLSCWEAPGVELRVRPGESLVLFTDGLLHRTGDCADRAVARVHAAAQSATGAVREDPGLLADHLLRAVLPGGLDSTAGAEDLVLLVARFD